MIKILITHPYGKSFDLPRQSPQGKGIWGNCQFFVKEPIETCDFWFVLDDLPNESSAFCKNPPIFITIETPSIRTKINDQFLAQFKKVISYGRDLHHPCVIETICLTGWFIGGSPESRKTYDDFVAPMPQINKNKLISVVSSNKTFTKGHRKRLKFVKLLRNHFGETIDIYGSGINPFPDKWDVTAPYKYHISLENSSCRNYISEKLYDAFLGESFPIYYGCPNVLDYFSKESLSVIDIDKPDESISIIENLIESETYEKSLDDIRKSKDLVLNNYNFFPILSKYCEEIYSQNPEKQLTRYTLENESSFSKISLLTKKTKNWLVNLKGGVLVK